MTIFDESWIFGGFESTNVQNPKGSTIIVSSLVFSFSLYYQIIAQSRLGKYEILLETVENL